ncbi:Frizzled-5 [Folsomia candida]|uniref:Frizzled-5 n=1 Tax=Folsomia candida TaxID=158441 RepID=A0A226F1C6_FOLCA|nr:Frizzled-5 [Folsomia candida]
MLLLTTLLFIITMATGTPQLTAPKCQPITIPMCRNIGYNFTQMPNPFNHDSQEEAGLEVHQYWPLVEIRCSPDLKFFICSLYVPICMEDYKGSVPACKSVCERAREGCEPVMLVSMELIF